VFKGRSVLLSVVHAIVTEERSQEENIRGIDVSQIQEQQLSAEQTRLFKVLVVQPKHIIIIKLLNC